MHKTIEENEQGLPEAMEIDLKCAEKVTDSDVESNADDKVRVSLTLLCFYFEELILASKITVFTRI